MKVLVTGSAGHLGEALVRTLAAAGYEVVGLDIRESPFTTAVGSVTERAFVRRNIAGAQVIFHAATLHKPHVATHARSEFVEVNIGGTFNLLEEAVAARVGAFVFTSTTSGFRDGVQPPPGVAPVLVTGEVTAERQKPSG